MIQTKLHLLFLILLGFLGVQSLERESWAKSPYSLSWGRESVWVGVGAASAVASTLLSSSVIAPTEAEIQRRDRSQVPFFDRPATYQYSPMTSKISDWMLGGIVSLPVIFLGALPQMRGDWFTVGALYAETMLFASFVSGYAKGGVQRYRPFTYNAEAPLEVKLEADARKSFFSGHSCGAFASAVFFSSVFGEYDPDSPARPYVWAGSLLLATTVGYLRFAAGNHFPSDILTGALIGSAIGYWVPKMHKRKSTSGTPQLSAGPAYFQVQFLF